MRTKKKSLQNYENTTADSKQGHDTSHLATLHNFHLRPILTWALMEENLFSIFCSKNTRFKEKFMRTKVEISFHKGSTGFFHETEVSHFDLRTWSDNSQDGTIDKTYGAVLWLQVCVRCSCVCS